MHKKNTVKCTITAAALLLALTGTAHAWGFNQVTAYSTDFLERVGKAPKGDPAELRRIGVLLESQYMQTEEITIDSESSSFDSVPFERWRVGLPDVVRHIKRDHTVNYKLPTICVYPDGFDYVLYDAEDPTHFMSTGAVMGDYTCTNAAEVMTQEGRHLRFDSLAAWSAHWQRMNNAVSAIPHSIAEAWDSVSHWASRNPIAIVLLTIAGIVGVRRYRKRKARANK